MEIFQDHLKGQGREEERIISINLEDYDFFELRQPSKLHSYIKERLIKDKMTYVFIDEIQHCENFPDVVDSLYIKKNVDLYLTGSNGYMLSSEISTLISGRYIEIPMLPLSFKEYVSSTGEENDLSKKYLSYIENSSFPYAAELAGLLESFILYQAKRYNIKGKQYLKTLEKYYVVDIGLRYMLLGTRGTDVGHILENVIYLELLRRGYEVYVGKVDDLEVDFVAMEQKRTIYFQVAATVRDEETLKRELNPLQKISDHYQKFILTLDEDPEADYEGIRRVNALDWLMGKIQ